MSLKERDRLRILSQVRDGQMSLKTAAKQLKVGYRQSKRLLKCYREQGDAGLVHQLRGRPSNNRPISDARRIQAIELYRQHYQGFGPTLAAEQLHERDGLEIDHETLRRWLIGEGIWKIKHKRGRRHRRRDRRPCFGELVQLDGSEHAWFGDEHDKCVLMVMIDDATGLTLARFFKAETTKASMTIFKQWSLSHGLPRALYPDQHSIYRRNDKAADEIEHRTGKRPLTRFGEAMEELNVELICAHSPQAKGRVERMNGTLQDRLVKLLKLEGITTIQAANAYLQETFLPAHNAKFTVDPTEATDVHKPVDKAELDASLCPVRERRVVDKTSCVSWRGRCFELTGEDATPRRRREVMVCQRLDGQVQLLAITDGRVLSSGERTSVPKAIPEPPASLSERVADHKGPAKPAKDHPWRQPALPSVAAQSRCARLRHDAGQDQTKGTVLLS